MAKAKPTPAKSARSSKPGSKAKAQAKAGAKPAKRAPSKSSSTKQAPSKQATKKPAQRAKQPARAAKKQKTFGELLAATITAGRAGKLDVVIELTAEAAAIANQPQRHQLELELQRHGNRALNAQKWKKAIALYEAGIAIMRPGDDTLVHSEMQNECGFALMQLHRLDEAEVRIAKSLELHDAAERTQNGADAIYYLSNVVFERGQLDKAVELGREAVRRSTEAGNERSVVLHAYSLARALYEQGHSKEAEEISKGVIEKARGFGYRAAEANFENMIANVALDDHRLVESRQHYERAKQLFHDLHYKGHEAITISNLGNLAWNEDRLDDALELYEDSIKLQKSTKDLRSIGIAVTARADVLRELGRFEEAHKDLESALATMTHKGHERRVSFVRAAFARLAEARDELEEARAHYAEAEMSLEAVGDTVEIGRMLYAAAGIEADLDDPESAEALLARAASLDPASLSPDKTGVGEKRAGMHAVRAYRELALARIEVARSRRMDGDDSTALRRSATARLQAITSARNSLMATSAEVRRVAARLVRRLGGDHKLLEIRGPAPTVRYAGTTQGSGWNTELTGEITISREPGTMLATGRLGWEQRAAQLELRGPDPGGPCVLTGTMKSVDGFPATWQLRFEVELADKVLRGRLIELVEQDEEQEAGEDEICQLAWAVAVAE